MAQEEIKIKEINVFKAPLAKWFGYKIDNKVYVKMFSSEEERMYYKNHPLVNDVTRVIQAPTQEEALKMASFIFT